MHDGNTRSGIGMTDREPFVKMLRFPGATRGDYRNPDGMGNHECECQFITVFLIVGINGIDYQFPSKDDE